MASNIKEIKPIENCEFLRKATSLANILLDKENSMEFLLKINKGNMSVANIFVEFIGAQVSLNEFKLEDKDDNKTCEYLQWIRDNKISQLNESLIQLAQTIKQEDKGYNQFLFFISVVLANEISQRHLNEENNDSPPIGINLSEPLSHMRITPEIGKYDLLDGLLQFEDMILYLYPKIYVAKSIHAPNDEVESNDEDDFSPSYQENLLLDTEIIVNNDIVDLKGSLTNISSETTEINKCFVPTRGFEMDIIDENGHELYSMICTKLQSDPRVGDLRPGEKFEFEHSFRHYRFQKQTLYHFTISYQRKTATSNQTKSTLFIPSCEPIPSRNNAQLKDLAQSISFKYMS